MVSKKMQVSERGRIVRQVTGERWRVMGSKWGTSGMSEMGDKWEVNWVSGGGVSELSESGLNGVSHRGKSEISERRKILCE